MKYGIDVNSIDLLKAITEKMKTKNQCIVDISVQKSNNKGELLFKKTLMANITKIDFYLAIDFDNKISKYEIFYDDNEISKKTSEEIKKIFEKSVEEIVYELGNRWYLMKNTNAPMVYIRIPASEELKIKEDYLDKIVEILINI